MAGGRVLGLLAVVVLVATVGVLVALAVMVRRLSGVIADTGRAVQLLSIQLSDQGVPTPVPAGPVAAGGVDPGSAEADAEWVVEVGDGVGAEPPAAPGSTTGPRLSEVAAATFGPPLVRAAALGYGIRTVLADRARPRPESSRRLFGGIGAVGAGGAVGGAGGSRAARDRARRRAARGRR